MSSLLSQVICSGLFVHLLHAVFFFTSPLSCLNSCFICFSTFFLLLRSFRDRSTDWGRNHFVDAKYGWVTMLNEPEESILPAMEVDCHEHDTGGTLDVLEITLHWTFAVYKHKIFRLLRRAAL